MRLAAAFCALVTLLLPARALAAATDAPVGPARESDDDVAKDTRAIVLGLHYDQGAASAFGLSAMHAWEHASGTGLGRGFTSIEVGLDTRLATRGFHGATGALGYGVGRASVVGGCTGGFGLELAAGAGAGGGVRSPFPAAAAGIFWGLYYFEVGYSYQFPLPTFERPDWLSSHQFSLRIQIPVLRDAERASGKRSGS